MKPKIFGKPDAKSLPKGGANAAPVGRHIPKLKDILTLRPKSMLSAFRAESLAFWFIAGYLFFEYVRPQMIIPAIAFLPWTQLFVVGAAVASLQMLENSKRAGGAVLFVMICLLIVMIMSAANAYVPQLAWPRLEAYYLWIIIFILLRRICVTQTQLFFLLVIFFLASAKMSYFGARTWAFRGFTFTTWGMKGPPGFFENSGELAVQMLVFFGLSAYLAMYFWPRLVGITRWFVVLAPVTAAMTVIASSSRGAQLALAIQFYLIFLRGKISFRALLVGGVLSVTLFSLLPDEQKERFTTIGEDRTSMQRILYWENGWEMMKDHPMLGVGYRNFIYYYETRYPEDMLYDGAELPHNIFIQIGADMGFTGLFFYLLLVLFGLTMPRKSIQLLLRYGHESDWRLPVARGLLVGFIGFLIAGQFVSIAFYPFLYIHLALSTILLTTVRRTIGAQLAAIDAERSPVSTTAVKSQNGS